MPSVTERSTSALGKQGEGFFGAPVGSLQSIKVL